MRGCIVEIRNRFNSSTNSIMSLDGNTRKLGRFWFLVTTGLEGLNPGPRIEAEGCRPPRARSLVEKTMRQSFIYIQSLTVKI